LTPSGDSGPVNGSGAPTRTAFCASAAEPNISVAASENTGMAAKVFNP
jgi:hypothetical protein